MRRQAEESLERPAAPFRPRSAFEGRLRDLLESVARGEASPEEAAAELRDFPFADLGFARVDVHRELRQGVCEIVFGQGKTAEEVAAIVARLLDANVGPVLVTRADGPQREAVRRLAEGRGLDIEERVRAGWPGAVAVVRNVPQIAGRILVLAAGTADLAVAEEAVLTASLMGARVELVTDVGVAGLHRLLAERSRLDATDVAIVVAGLDAALASVVGGLAPCPVVACPTSVGYGSSFGGLAALLSMLNSCAPGVVCVGIDDGVGAGYAAGLVARLVERDDPRRSDR